jgi:O-antigen/teichoic acid export membrane protein
MDFGLHQVTVRAIARDPGSLRHTAIVAWPPALVLLMVATNTLRKEPDVRMACYLTGGASIFRSYMLTIRGVLQGLERFGWESIVVIADRVLLLTLGTYALWSGAGLRGLTIAFVAARGLALLLAAVITQMSGGIARDLRPRCSATCTSPPCRSDSS